MDKQIYTNQEVKQIVRNYKRLLKKNNILFDSVYLFGSYAKKAPRPWSDIDVAVISSRFGNDPIEEGIKLDEMADQISLAIEPHPLSLTEFKQQLHPLSREISSHGIKV